MPYKRAAHAVIGGMNFHPPVSIVTRFKRLIHDFLAREKFESLNNFSSYYCLLYRQFGNTLALHAATRARALSCLMAVIVLRLLSYSMLGILILGSCVVRKHAEAAHTGCMLTRINASVH